MKSAIEESQQRAVAFSRQLEVELSKRTQEDDGGRHQKQVDDVQLLKTQQIGLRRDIDTARQSVQSLDTGAEQGSEEYKQLKVDLANAERDLQDCTQAISRAHQGKNDPLAPYTARGNIKGALAAIQQDNSWVGTRPLGPIGTYITLKDQQWSNTIDTVLSGQLNGFVCSSRQDIKRLGNLLKRFGLGNLPIFFGNHNNRLEEQLSRVDPGPQFTTIYKVLNVSIAELTCHQSLPPQ